MIYEIKRKNDSYGDIMCEFGEINLDIIQFEANMFNIFANRDYISLQALDESSLQIINEMTFKEAFNKLISFIDSIIDKIREVVRKIITNLQVKFDAYSKFASKIEEKIKNSEWKDSNEYIDLNLTSIFKEDDWKSMTDDEFATASGMITYMSSKVVKSIREYIDAREKSELLIADNPRQFIDAIINSTFNKKNNSIYDAAKVKINIVEKTFKVKCSKESVDILINSLKGAKSHLQWHNSFSKNIMNSLSDMKKEVHKLQKEENDEAALKTLADIQKVISVYSSAVNSCLNAAYSGLGYAYSQYMKVLKTIVGKCATDVKN